MIQRGFHLIEEKLNHQVNKKPQENTNKENFGSLKQIFAEDSSSNINQFNIQNDEIPNKTITDSPDKITTASKEKNNNDEAIGFSFNKNSEAYENIRVLDTVNDTDNFEFIPMEASNSDNTLIQREFEMFDSNLKLAEFDEKFYSETHNNSKVYQDKLYGDFNDDLILNINKRLSQKGLEKASKEEPIELLDSEMDIGNARNKNNSCSKDERNSKYHSPKIYDLETFSESKQVSYKQNCSYSNENSSQKKMERIELDFDFEKKISNINSNENNTPELVAKSLKDENEI